MPQKSKITRLQERNIIPLGHEEEDSDFKIAFENDSFGLESLVSAAHITNNKNLLKINGPLSLDKSTLNSNSLGPMVKI